jgi:hypothetical protein
LNTRVVATPGPDQDPLTDARALFQTENADIGTPHGTPTDAMMWGFLGDSYGSGSFVHTKVSHKSAILEVSATNECIGQDPFAMEQRRDPNVQEIIDFLERGILPEDND